MKILKYVALVALVLGLTIGSAQAGPFVGIEAGPSFNSTSNTTVGGYQTANPKFNVGGAVGIMGGYDFNDPKFASNPYAKYFSVAGDFMWNGFNPQNTLFNSKTGNQYAIAALGIVKYPLMVTDQYKTGRLFPYVGFGPGVVFSNVGSKNATAAVLVVEPGVKYMVTPKVSVDAAYRFRYSYASFGGTGVGTNVLNNMVLLRANYHF